ncbi:SiaB family protein kinase [Desulfatiferula olefinivorans]
MTLMLYSLRESFSKNKIIFCYSGPMSQDLMVEIGNTLKNKMQQDAFNRSMVAKTFAILVEQVQNIIHYSKEQTALADEYDRKLSSGIVAVGFEDGGYFVSSGNMIYARDKEKIAQMIDRINAMDPEEKKRYYKERRKQGPDEGSRGAGLGFIEMARKSDRPVDYDFIDLDSGFCFFSIRLHI